MKGRNIKLKRYSIDDFIKIGIYEKKEFLSHQGDLCYASHHKKVWVNIESLNDYVSSFGLVHIEGLTRAEKDVYDKKPLTIDNIKKMLEVKENGKRRKK